MSSKQQPNVREVIMKKAESIGQQIDEIKASDLPPHVKEQKIAVLDSELKRLAKAYNSLLRQ
jgi:hypothetical protein